MPIEQIHGAQPSKKLDMLNKWPFFLWATWVRAGRLCNLLSALGCLRHHWGWLWVNIRGLLGACEPSEDLEKHSRPTGYPRSRPTPPSQKSRNSLKKHVLKTRFPQGRDRAALWTASRPQTLRQVTRLFRGRARSQQPSDVHSESSLVLPQTS